jgi:hypothetical protein
MEDFGGLIWIAIIWFFVTFLSSQKKRKQRAEQARRQARTRTRPPPPRPKPTTVVGSGRSTGSSLPDRPDATQQEGTALERMLRQLSAGMEQLESSQRGPMGRHGEVTLPSAEEVEEREVLDLPVDRGERRPVVRETRVLVDHDDEAEALLERRLAVVEEYNRPRTVADHRVFDQEIRQQEAEIRVEPRFDRTTTDMRRVIAWREILGPPPALRDPFDW